MEILSFPEILELITTEILTVRDFPYTARLKGDKPKSLQELIRLTESYKTGNCSSKHYYLAYKLSQYGISSTFLTFPFYWHELPVKFPSQLRQTAKELPIQYHLALQIHLQNTDLLIDVTWDSVLKKLGFPVNSDDILNMKLGVIPAGDPIVHSTAEERWKFIETIKPTIPKPELVNYFYTQLDLWLESVRNQLLFSNRTQ